MSLEVFFFQLRNEMYQLILLLFVKIFLIRIVPDPNVTNFNFPGRLLERTHVLGRKRKNKGRLKFFKCQSLAYLRKLESQMNLGKFKT